MAYYDALIAKWATLTPGTTAAKLAQLNGLTVATGAPGKAYLTPSQIINAIVPADLAGLTAGQVALLTLLLQGGTIDVSQGTTIRAAMLVLFTGKAQTIANLAALVAQQDAPVLPWWQTAVVAGGGGLLSQPNLNDLAAAGGLT